MAANLTEHLSPVWSRIFDIQVERGEGCPRQEQPALLEASRPSQRPFR